MTLGEIYDYVNIILDKDVEGDVVSPGEFNNLLKFSNIELYLEEKKMLEELIKISNPEAYDVLYMNSALRVFRKTITIGGFANGLYNLPTEFKDYITAITNYNGGYRKIIPFSDVRANQMRSNASAMPVSENPFCIYNGGAIQFYPKDVGASSDSIEFTYLRDSDVPYMDWCVVDSSGEFVYMPSGYYVKKDDALDYNLYDSGNTLLYQNVTYRNGNTSNQMNSVSVELEWDNDYQIAVANKILQKCGVKIRDQFVLQTTTPREA